MFGDTIAAVATGQIEAAISIIRMSGPEAVTVADRIFDHDLKQAKGYTIHYGTIMDGEEPVDVLLDQFQFSRKTRLCFA